jgi:hypothetical protein
MSCNDPSCMSLEFFLTNRINDFEYLYDSLCDINCIINSRWIDFTTAHCFTKPVAKSYFRNKDFCGHAFKRVQKLLNVSSERRRRVRSRLFSVKKPIQSVLINILLFWRNWNTNV